MTTIPDPRDSKITALERALKTAQSMLADMDRRINFLERENRRNKDQIQMIHQQQRRG